MDHLLLGVVNRFRAPQVDVDARPFRQFSFLLREQTDFSFVSFLRQLTPFTTFTVLFAILEQPRPGVVDLDSAVHSLYSRVDEMLMIPIQDASSRRRWHQNFPILVYQFDLFNFLVGIFLFLLVDRFLHRLH